MKARLHTELHGSGEQSIVICNGLSQTTANWRTTARGASHYRWLLFDARGHGKSPVGPRPYAIDDHVDDLHWALEKHGIQKPVLMGFSHGGRVALRAAAEFPESFSRLVLVSTASRTSARRRAHVESWRNCLELGGVRAMAWASLPTIIGPGILDRFSDLGLLVKGSVSRNNEEGLRRMFEGMATYPEIRADAERVRCPTLLLRGARDQLVDDRDNQNFTEWIASARAFTFEGCGHTLPLEEPEDFMRALDDFLG